jgi:hypothetical protein
VLSKEKFLNGNISDTIAPVDSPNERPNPKKFFTYLKSIRKESNGVPTLKAFGETVKLGVLAS